MQIKDKVFVVTGAGSGIGKELVAELLKLGATVAVVDLRAENLDSLKNSTKADEAKVSIHVLDISDKVAVEKLPEAVIAKHGKVDAIINNAGIIQPFVKINDLNYEAINKVMNVNFYGTLYMTKAFLPHLLKRPEAYIANVSSMGGFLPVPGQGIYGASKAAVKLFTEALYAELANTKIGVSIVYPGATNTNITINSGIKSQVKSSDQVAIPMLPAKDVASMIIHGISKNKFQIFTGKDSKLMNFLYRISPTMATNLIANKMSSLLPK